MNENSLAPYGNKMVLKLDFKEPLFQHCVLIVQDLLKRKFGVSFDDDNILNYIRKV